MSGNTTCFISSSIQTDGDLIRRKDILALQQQYDGSWPTSLFEGFLPIIQSALDWS